MRKLPEAPRTSDFCKGAALNPNYTYNATVEEWLTGKYDCTIIEVREGNTRLGWYAKTRSWEGPLRPKFVAARADLTDLYYPGTGATGRAFNMLKNRD